jgi:hypothetical protein
VIRSGLPGENLGQGNIEEREFYLGYQQWASRKGLVNLGYQPIQRINKVGIRYSWEAGKSCRFKHAIIICTSDKVARKDTDFSPTKYKFSLRIYPETCLDTSPDHGVAKRTPNPSSQSLRSGRHSVAQVFRRYEIGAVSGLWKKLGHTVPSILTNRCQLPRQHLPNRLTYMARNKILR